MRFTLLLFTTVLPGLATTIVSGYFVLIDWAALSRAHARVEQVAQSPDRTMEAIAIAQQAETRHRINCFAEGVGVLLGGIWMSIGIHGICIQPKRAQQ